MSLQAIRTGLKKFLATNLSLKGKSQEQLLKHTLTLNSWQSQILTAELAKLDQTAKTAQAARDTQEGAKAAQEQKNWETEQARKQRDQDREVERDLKHEEVEGDKMSMSRLVAALTGLSIAAVAADRQLTRCHLAEKLALELADKKTQRTHDSAEKALDRANGLEVAEVRFRRVSEATLEKINADWSEKVAAAVADASKWF